MVMWDKEKVRKLKIAMFTVMMATLVVYIANKLMLNDKFDNTYPEIQFEQDLLEVSVKATEQDLLQGVTATDKKDGDITDSIIIENMSNMLENNERIVTYVAFDRDKPVYSFCEC